MALRVLWVAFILGSGLASASGQESDDSPMIAGRIDHLSKAIGVKAIQDIVNSTERQKELDVSPMQVTKLEGILRSGETRAAFLKVMHDQELNPLSVRAARAKDRIVMEKARQILEPSQIESMRVTYLRRHFKYPLDVFGVENLLLLGFNQSEATEIYVELVPVLRKRILEDDKSRAEALEEILGLLSAEAKQKFVRCFGAEVLPDSNDLHDDGAAVAVFREAKGMELLLSAPQNVPDRWDQLLAIINDQYARKKKDPNYNMELGADAGLKATLNGDQLSLCIRRKQLSMLRGEFSILARAEFVRYLGIEGEAAADYQKACKEAQSQMHKLRLERDWACFNAAVDRLPAKVRADILEMFKGVWTIE